MERRTAYAELRTANPADRIALRGVRLRARLSGMSLKARLDQTFVNLEVHAIEAVYTFPLPEGAAVCGFEVVTGDRVLTGRIEETGDAIEKYEQAVAEGHGAFLAEQERPDVFTLRVGNLKPKQAATIRLSFVAPLELADRAICVAFPTTVAPRYVTAAGTSDPIEAQIDGDALNPPHVLHVPYGLTMEVEVALGRAASAITSPTHPVAVASREDGSSLVTFAGGSAAMDRDVVLSIRTAREPQPTVQAARGPGEAIYLAVTFVPDFGDEGMNPPPPSETVFVLDCSGSMQGESIAQATAALELCLRSLSEGDTFNICRFGSSFELMSSEPLPYNAATLAKAIHYVRQGADLGGTELLAPLEAILAEPPAVGAVRQIILLTDGQISNEPAVIDLARKGRGRNRIFSFGIGSACSAHLVKGLDRATGGAAEFISGAERIEDNVLRVFGRISSPQVTDVRLDWGGAEVQTLAELPPVFDGEILTVFGRCAGTLPQSIQLQCTTPQGRRSWPLPVPAASEDDGVIATLWARRTIQSLEEVNGVRRTSVSDRLENRAKQEMIRLSKEFGLLSALTTFVTVEHRSLEERNSGTPETRKVPTMLAAGWGGVEQCRGGPAAAMPCAPPSAANTALAMDLSLGACFEAAPPSKISRGLGDLLRKAIGGGGMAKRMRAEPQRFVTPAAPPAGASAPAPSESEEEVLDRLLKDLLGRQSAEGWFDESPAADEVMRLRNLNPDEVRAKLDPAAATPGRRRIGQTLLVLFLFKAAFPDRAGLWKRAYEKAVRWLGRVGTGAPEVENLIDAVAGTGA